MLYDSYGAPLREDALEREHSAESRELWGPGHYAPVAPTLNPRRLASLLRAADAGDARAYFTLAEELEERDLHYRGVIAQRKLAVTLAPIVVQEADDSAAGLEQADAVRDLAEQDIFPGLIADLMDAPSKCLSIVEILWRTGERFTPRAYRWRDQRRFKIDRVSGKLRYDDHTIEGEALPPFRYIVHEPKLKSGLPLRGGIARAVAIAFVMKTFSVRDLHRFLEVYGIPARIGRYDKSAGKSDRAALLRAARALGSDAAAIIPSDMSIELLNTRPGGGEAFIDSVRWWDEQISKCVLGQTMTADNGSSKSQAQVHNNVRIDFAQHDARQVSATLNQQLIRPFIDLNFGEQARYPRVSISIREKDALAAFVSSVTMLVDRGLEVDQRVIRDRIGIPDPQPGVPLLKSAAGVDPRRLGEEE
jgi:phage gp29-like protein